MTDSAKSGKVVPGYEKEPMRKKVKLVTEEYEYELPFNYENITVDRLVYKGSEFHGMEMYPVNDEGVDGDKPTYADAIIVEEPHPIVRVAVIGSACTPPGYIQIECEPVEGWRRPDELVTAMPVRMRINGLWGMHIRWDQWYARSRGVIPVGSDESYEKMPDAFLDNFSGLKEGSVKSHYREFPLTGMSCAIFEIPPCKKVTVMGGAETPGWRSDNFPNDAHYSFRIIRTTVHVA